MKAAATPTLALAALLLLPGTPAAGQTTLILTGGVNSASMDFRSSLNDFLGLTAPLGSTESVGITRFAAGAAVAFQLSARWGVQLGGAYSKKGGRWELGTYYWNSDVLLETDYLEFTALGRMRVKSPDEVSVVLLAGPALSWQSGCGVKESGYIYGRLYEANRSCNARGPLASRRSNVDLGVALGGVLEVPTWEGPGVSLGVMYTSGLLAVSGDFGSALKHRVLTLQAGILYPIFR